MKVEDVMTRDVVTAVPETPLRIVARTLAERGVSGLPVVDEGRVVGVVSEGDILVKEAAEEKLALLSRLRGRRTGAAKKAARSAAEAMSAPAITVTPQRDVAEAARLMVERAVNRLPVVSEEGTLVGIVTRADLVRAFVRTDEQIARELRDDVAARTLWIDPESLEISVHDGEVTLGGEVDSRADAELLERFAARYPGVVTLRSQLRWRVDRPKPPESDPRVPHPPAHR